MRRLPFALLAALLLGGCMRPLTQGRNPVESGTTTRSSTGIEALTLQSGGRTRSYSLTVPTRLSPTASIPLVIVLHGLGGNGKQIIGDDGWTRLGLTKGVLVAGPDALPRNLDKAATFLRNPRMWRTGGEGDVNDVGFIRDLIALLERQYPVDKRRVYVVGHSNGGGMTFRMAMDDGSEIAAIGTVASQMLLKYDKPAHPMPTICFMGSLDPLIPPQGGTSALPTAANLDLPAASVYLGKWASANGFPSASTISNSATAKIEQYGPKFATWLVKGQGHAWPGGDQLRLPKSFVGPQLNTVNATQQIWRFLSQHRLPQSAR